VNRNKTGGNQPFETLLTARPGPGFVLGPVVRCTRQGRKVACHSGSRYVYQRYGKCDCMRYRTGERGSDGITLTARIQVKRCHFIISYSWTMRVECEYRFDAIFCFIRSKPTSFQTVAHEGKRSVHLFYETFDATCLLWRPGTMNRIFLPRVSLFSGNL
jgi:hypothetical protein